MRALTEGVKRYLRLRRALGFELRGPGAQLRNFARFMAQRGEVRITTALAVAWATQPPGASEVCKGRRLAAVRRFAAWWRATDPRTDIPPASLLPYRLRRQRPYIYTPEEIRRLLACARRLVSGKTLRGETYATVFALLAVTGLRVSEVVALDRADVDLVGQAIFVRRTKFGKSRLVPIHRSTAVALTRYAELRDKAVPVTTSPAFFVSDSRRKRITDWSTRYNFAMASRSAGIRPAAKGYRHGTGPRIHDLRHSFAVQTMIDWYRLGLEVERELPKLSSYLGHVHVHDTYWYLEAVPELLRLAVGRVDRADGRRK